MANRYWVGGSGTWNTTSTANWSASSGGPSGASAPTSADSVFFDQAASYTVTSSSPVCLDLTVSAGTVIFTSASYTISGSLNLNATISFSGNLIFNGSSSHTITTNGTSLPTVTLNGTGTYTLGSALTFLAITLTSGNFSTSASNYSLTGASSIITISSNTNVRSLNFNGSAVSCRYITTGAVTTNFTFNAGTSTITFAGGPAGNDAVLPGLSYYDVVFSPSIIVATNLGANFSCRNFNCDLTGTTTSSVVFYLAGNMTVTGTLTTSTATYYRRIIFCSTESGTQRTITAAAVSLADTDFQDIIGAGAATWTGSRLGDGGNNTSITGFPVAKTVYYVAATAANFLSANWATGSGGGTSSANYPLPQDTAIIDNNSGTGTLTFGPSTVTSSSGMCALYGNIDFSARTNALTVNFTACPAICGNITSGSGVSYTSTGTLKLKSTTSKTTSPFGSSFNANLAIDCPTFTLSGNFTLPSTCYIYLSSGTLSLSNFTLSSGLFNSSNLVNYAAASKSISFGTGNITTTGSGTTFSNGPYNFSYSGTSQINITYSGATATSVVTDSGAASTESNAMNINVTAGTYNFTFSGSANNFSYNGFAGTVTSSLYSIYGNFLYSTGMTVNSGNISFRATSGSKTITTNGKPFGIINFYGGAVLPSSATYALQDNLTSSLGTSAVNINNQNVNLNGKTLTCATVACAASAGTSGNLTFNGGSLVISGASFTNNAGSSFTTTAGTGVGTIKMTSASAKTFAGDGATYNCTLDQGGAGALSITGNNTFNNVTNTYSATGATSVLFAAGSVNTFTNFNVTGTVGKVCVLSSISGTAQAYLVKSSTWYMGANSTDSGNNTALVFTAGGGIDYLNVSYINGGPPTLSSGNFLMMFG